MSLLGNKYDISMWQGSTFGLTAQLVHANNTPKNISGQQIRMQIRSSFEEETPEETLTTSNGEITITDAANGTFHIELSAARTANIEVDLYNLSTVKLEDDTSVKLPKQTYVYDVEMDNSGQVTKVLYGKVFVYGEVTRNV